MRLEGCVVSSRIEIAGDLVQPVQRATKSDVHF
jgi:hypothetical protein